MKLLAFDTSTETLSLAVCWHDGAQVRQLHHRGGGGREASATLIPAAMALLAQAGLRVAQLDAIVFGSGPGSFTGLRTACSVAQGLAFGAGGVPVLPVESLLAVAEQARLQAGAQKVLAVLDARMDEVYAAVYAYADGRWARFGAITLGPPESLHAPAGYALAGNAFAAYGLRLPAADQHIEALPDAAALLSLAPALLAQGLALPAEQALPLYVRDKVALTTEERQARRDEAAP